VRTEYVVEFAEEHGLFRNRHIDFFGVPPVIPVIVTRAPYFLRAPHHRSVLNFLWLDENGGARRWGWGAASTTAFGLGPSSS